MIFPGHFASVMLAARAVKVDRPTALAASVFPDLLDKGLHWVARLTPSDRLWGHTAWVITGTTALAWLVGRLTGRKKMARSWLMGYLVHLAGDLVAPLPFFYPLTRQGYHHGARLREVMAGQRRPPYRVLFIEGLLLLAAGLTEWHFRVRRR